MLFGWGLGSVRCHLDTCVVAMSQTACFRFSEHFGITPDAEDDWFDLLLTADTQLFVDPFRVYAASEGPFAGAHDELIAFFQRVMGLLASGRGRDLRQVLHVAHRAAAVAEERRAERIGVEDISQITALG